MKHTARYSQAICGVVCMCSVYCNIRNNSRESNKAHRDKSCSRNATEVTLTLRSLKVGVHAHERARIVSRESAKSGKTESPVAEMARRTARHGGV